MTTPKTDDKTKAYMHPCCADCRFYDNQHDNPDYDHMEVGYCRKYAPRPFTVKYLNGQITDQCWAYFPLVQNDEFCGEFEHKAEAADGVLPWQKARITQKPHKRATSRSLSKPMIDPSRR